MSGRDNVSTQREVGRDNVSTEGGWLSFHLPQLLDQAGDFASF